MYIWNRSAILSVLAVTFPLLTLADVSGTPSLTANMSLNLDTGATGTSGGDLLSDGANLIPQGNAAAFNFGPGGQAQFDSLTQMIVSAIPSAALTKSPIAGTVGTIIVVHTNGGNYAKVLVSANSGGTVGLRFTTYTSGTGGGGQGMTITAVENSATNIPPGLPNAGIAQGSLFVVKGTGLGPASIAIAPAFPFTTSIGGTSAQVTVGGTTVDAIMFYSLATQIAAILPSKTPAGTGTMKLTYNGQSASGPITVVQSNVGIFTVSQTGTGDAVAFLNSDSSLITPTHAANAGDALVFWGTGLGPVSGDETQPAVQSDLTNVPLQVFIGGKQANVLFRGRNGCCTSIDTVYATMPSGLSGCAVSVIMQIGNVVSNSTTIAAANNGRRCTPVSGTQGGGGVGATGTHSFGGIALERIVEIPSTGAPSKMDLVGATFEKVTYGNTSPTGSQIDVNAYGSCTVSTFVSGQTPSSNSGGMVQWLDAGPSIAMAAPFGNRSLDKNTVAGITTYLASLDQTATTFTAGQYTFTGPGGPDVGPFTAVYTLPTPFVWANQSSITTVNRSAGVTVNWTGGDPAGYVTIAGSSTAYGATAATTVTASFTCTAPASALTFTVPSVVLLALPASSAPPGSPNVQPGSLSLSNVANAQPFGPPAGIEFAGVGGIFVYGGSVTYQ